MRILLLTAGILSAACHSTSRFEPTDPGDWLGTWIPGPAATILQGSAAGLRNPTMAVVSDSSAWGALWTLAWGGPALSPPLPSIDFVLTSVVVVGLGTLSGQGHAIAIDSIVVRTVGSTLHATATQPATHCPLTAGTSAPVHMVHSPGHPPIVDWEIRTVRGGCAPQVLRGAAAGRPGSSRWR